MHPTPHGLALVTATPLGTPVVTGPHVRRAGRATQWRAQLQVRTWVLVAFTLPLALGVAASTADAVAETSRIEAQDRALAEAARFAQTVAEPLRQAVAPPSADRLHEMRWRMQRLSEHASLHGTTTQLRLASPTGVQVVSRAAIAPGAGTAVCVSAVKWPAAPTVAGPVAVKASWKGPLCFVEGRGGR